MNYIRAALEACPIISAVFILAGLTGISHSAWVVINLPTASLSEVLGVDTVWFYPWLTMGFAFLALIGNGVAVMRSARRLATKA